MKNIIQTTIYLLVFCATLNAQPGTLDNTFSDNGKGFYNEFTGSCKAIVIQKDGKIVTGGFHDAYNIENTGFIVARFNINGSLDESFGTNGKTIITGVENAEMTQDFAALAIQEDGKIIGCGRVVGNNIDRYSDIAIIRLDANGKLDNSFSNNGVLILNLKSEDQVTDLALQTDGKILITGRIKETDIDRTEGFVVRILSDGNYDETFGENGIRFTSFNYAILHVKSLTLQQDNKILICGEYFGKSLFVIRFLPDGTLDNTFDEENDGIAGIRYEENDVPFATLNDIAVQPDGKILVTGSAGGSSYKMALARFKSDGSIDSAFGDKTGYTIVPIENNGVGIAYHVEVVSDKIIVTGLYSTTDPNSNFGVVRFNMDGTLDASFGENGIAVAGFLNLGIISAGYGAIQEDGKIIIGGSGYQEGETDFTNVALVRFNNDAILPITYNKFTATQTKEYIALNWQTATELNNKYFAVERSSNAVNYAAIAQVNSTVTGTAVKDYFYTDKQPVAGTNYYRLKQVDADGKFSYSKVVSIGFIKPGTIQLFPNPAKEQLTVKGLNAAVTSTIAVLDVQGKPLLHFTAKAAVYSFSINSLAAGTYMVRVKDDNGTAIQKFVKQ